MLRAALFDMDGLLVDTEPIWTVAERELAAELGGVFGPELKARIVGTRLEVAVPTILAHFGAPTTPARVAEASAWLLERMAALFALGTPLLPGAGDLLAALRAEGVKVALVSSSYRALVDAVLAHGAGPFDVTVAGDEVARGKPDPEPYLLAATRLAIAPAECVVLEDSAAGVSSGEAAGCAVVAVPSVPGVSFGPAPRRWVADSLVDVDLDGLRALVAEPSAAR